MDDINDFAAFGEKLADASGEIVLSYWRSQLEVIRKSDESPVTRADREAEKKIRELIEAEYPHHGISGEEFGNVRLDAEYIWSLDPIDGTKAFISGSPLFGTLIALLKNGAPIMGIINIPATGERWIGGKDLPANLNGVEVRVRKGLALSEATLASTSPKMFLGKDAERIQRVQDKVKLPIFGGDCYLYGMLTLGTIDLVIEASMSDYDYLAPTAMVHAAGGVVTGWAGEQLGLGTTDKIVAAGDPKLHAEVIKLLNND